IDWMQRLIQDLLDVSAIEAGRLSVERSPAALPRIVSSAVELVRGDATERALDVRVEVADTLPPVSVDAARIVQVLTNLLGNAIKFTEPRGRVAVRAVVDSAWVIVSVQDTGVGIPGDEQ